MRKFLQWEPTVHWGGQIWDSREPLIMQNPAQPDEGVNCENHHQIVDS